MNKISTELVMNLKIKFYLTINNRKDKNNHKNKSNHKKILLKIDL